MLVINRKLSFIVAIIGIIAALFAAGVFVFIKIQASGFVKVKAVIVDVSTETEESSAAYWVTYAFDVNDRTSKAIKQVFSKKGKNIGDTVYIRYDPENPETLENTYAERASITVAIILTAFSAFLMFFALFAKNR